MGMLRKKPPEQRGLFLLKVRIANFLIDWR